MGTERVRKGSKVMDTFSQVRQVTVDLSCPYIKSTMMDLFLASKPFQCS